MTYLLIEKSLTFLGDKPIAVSDDLNKLVRRAQEEHLHIDAIRLRRERNARIDDNTQMQIVEVEIIA